MFGRLVDVFISNETDTIHLVNSELGNKSLACHADITCVPNAQRTTCVMSIYNIDKETRSMLKANNYRYLLVKFGYKDVNGGTTSTIFEGTVQRMIVKRQSPTTSVCIMYAYTLGDAYNYGFFSGEIEKGTSLYDACMMVAHKGEVDIPLVCTDAFKNFYLAKTQSFYDTQMNVIQKLSEAVHGVEMHATLGKLYISTSEENDNTEVIIMSGENENGKIVSTSGLVNIPTLEDDGLSFECLINPNLRIFSRVLIANSLISENQEGFESRATAGATYDENGIYVVNKIDISLCNDADNCLMSVRALARSMYTGGSNEAE